MLIHTSMSFFRKRGANAFFGDVPLPAHTKRNYNSARSHKQAHYQHTNTRSFFTTTNACTRTHHTTHTKDNPPRDRQIYARDNKTTRQENRCVSLARADLSQHHRMPPLHRLRPTARAIARFRSGGVRAKRDASLRSDSLFPPCALIAPPTQPADRCPDTQVPPPRRPNAQIRVSRRKTSSACSPPIRHHGEQRHRGSTAGLHLHQGRIQGRQDDEAAGESVCGCVFARGREHTDKNKHLSSICRARVSVAAVVGAASDGGGGGRPVL